MRPVYLDSSALLKLILPEPERAALVQALKPWRDRVSSVLLAIECHRALIRAGCGPAVHMRLDVELATVTLVHLDDQVRRLAASIGPRDLLSLDAIHLATACSLGDLPEAFVTYDDRLAAAGRTAGLLVLTPGRVG